MFVIQVRFLGSHGKMANQFFGGIGTYSHAPLWVNLLSDAIKYESAETAQEVLEIRIHSRREGYTYSVVAIQDADETARRIG